MAKEDSSMSINKPPFFNKSDYGLWKSGMKIFLNVMDYRVWSSIVESYTKPFTLKSEWSRSKMEAYNANLKGLNAIYRALRSDEHKIGTLRTAKETWDLIERTHESVLISSREEMLLSKERTSLGSKVFVTFGTLMASHDESESRSGE